MIEKRIYDLSNGVKEVCLVEDDFFKLSVFSNSRARIYVRFGDSVVIPLNWFFT